MVTSFSAGTEVITDFSSGFGSGTTDQPDGTTYQPDETTTYQPDGTTYQPDGTTYQPDGTTYQPDETTTTPYTATTPHGQVFEPTKSEFQRSLFDIVASMNPAFRLFTFWFEAAQCPDRLEL